MLKWITSMMILTFALSAFAVISKDELKDRKAALTSEGTHRRLSRAHSLLSQNKVGECLEVLDRLEKAVANRPAELAQVLQTKGFALAQQDKFKQAKKVLQQAMDLNVLPYAPTMSTLYTIAQVQLAEEDYSGAEQTLKQWFLLADEPSADAYVLLASIHAQKKDQKKALELVTKAIDMTKEPKESWLSFAVAMNYELKNYKESARLLEKLTGLFPEKKKYWKQLAGVYLNIDMNKEALATLDLAKKADYLDEEGEILNLVSLNLYGGIPLNAAKILAQAMDNNKVKKSQKHYEILGDCWAQAEEMDKALAAYAQSAKLADDGRIFAKQGRIYLEQENWVEAEKYLSQGLAKGKINKQEHVHMALGIARFNLKKFGPAIESFKVAQQHSETLKNQADQWITFVKTEEARLNPQAAATSEDAEGDVDDMQTL